MNYILSSLPVFINAIAQSLFRTGNIENGHEESNTNKNLVYATIVAPIILVIIVFLIINKKRN